MHKQRKLDIQTIQQKRLCNTFIQNNKCTNDPCMYKTIIINEYLIV